MGKTQPLKSDGSPWEALASVTLHDVPRDGLRHVSGFAIYTALRSGLVKLECIRQFWGATKTCRESADGREWCVPCRLNAAIIDGVDYPLTTGAVYASEAEKG